MKQVGTTLDGQMLVEISPIEASTLRKAIATIDVCISDFRAIFQFPPMPAAGGPDAPKQVTPATKAPNGATRAPKPAPLEKSTKGSLNTKPAPGKRSGKIPWSAMISEALSGDDKPMSTGEVYALIKDRPELAGVSDVKKKLFVAIARPNPSWMRVGKGLYTSRMASPKLSGAGSNGDRLQALLRMDPAAMTMDELRERLSLVNEAGRKDCEGRQEHMRRIAAGQ